jgi:uncharacterized Fe-S cluster protein YjdI
MLIKAVLKVKKILSNNPWEIKEYSNGEIIIFWKPEKCIHSAVCEKTLPNVYNPQEKPWISLKAQARKN